MYPCLNGAGVYPADRLWDDVLLKKDRKLSLLTLLTFPTFGLNT